MTRVNFTRAERGIVFHEPNERARGAVFNP
jgi:hypothetical protein